MRWDTPMFCFTACSWMPVGVAYIIDVVDEGVATVIIQAQ